jgi:hypothetical protein
MAGSSELAIEFTDLMIDDVLVPISTSGLQAQGQNEAARTVGRTARAAAIGGLIDGSSGARTGARVGAGASILTRFPSRCNPDFNSVVPASAYENYEVPGGAFGALLRVGWNAAGVALEEL